MALCKKALLAAAFCSVGAGCETVWRPFIDELSPPPCDPAAGSCVSDAPDLSMATDDLGGDVDLSVNRGDMATNANNDMATPVGMLFVNGGTFTMGLQCVGALSVCYKQSNVSVRPFWLDKTEVNQAAYKLYADAMGRTYPWTRSFELCNSGPALMNEHPVQCVSYNEAGAYCAYHGKRLPTEEEWEFAAVGASGNEFPWGPTADNSKACYGFGAPCVIGVKGQTFQGMVAANGFADLVGNVREWTTSEFCPAGVSGCIQGVGTKAPRGGAWNDITAAAVSCHSRSGNLPGEMHDNLGFRCAKDY